MICRHCGIEFDTAGVTGDTVRCPRCGMLYRRKAPPAVQDPRAGLTVPVFIPKGPGAAAPPPASPVREHIPAAVPDPVRQQAQIPQRPAGFAQGPVPQGMGNRNGYPPREGAGAPSMRNAGGKRKKTHHVRTTLLLILVLVIAGIALTVTGLGDIFPRRAEKSEVPGAEEQVKEPAEEEPDDGVEWLGRTIRIPEDAACLFFRAEDFAVQDHLIG